MNAKPVRYHLRFQVIPGRNAEKNAGILAKLCQDHGIEEVVLFFAGEEWNNGLLSKREEDVWFNTVRKVKRILDRAGVVCSLNPWMTTLHGARGRRFPPDRKFKPMVSPLGEASKACASFADPAWQKYVCELFGRFAALGFRVIWVEDDYRFHNHSPLTWGGGFEPEVLERFSRRIGRKAGRETVVRNILKPGKPHPWRAEWMAVWRELQLEVAAGLAKSVAAKSPIPSRLGLMSSGLGVHSTEGRDWRRLFDALSIEGRVAHRPHFAAYSEWPGRHQTYPILMMDAQRNLRPANSEVAPEVENFPYTSWNKSDAQTWSEMTLCMFYASDALLLNIYPFTGNPVSYEPGVAAMLDRSRPALAWIAARFTKDMATQGVGAPWREDAQAHVQTRQGKSLDEFNADPLGPGQMLLPFGIPVSARRQPVNAVFGNLAWAFSDAEWKEMLSGGVLLDGLSADVLCRRGFAKDIGVEVKRWHARQESTFSMEMVVSKDAGVPMELYTSVNLLDRIAELQPLKGAREWTTVITPTRKRIGAGTAAFRNARGGRVFTYAVANPGRIAASDNRRLLVQNAVAFLAENRFASPTVTGGPHLMPVHLKGPSGHALVICNGGTDPARAVIRLPRGMKSPATATLLAPLATAAPARLRGASVLESLTEIPYLGYLVLEFLE